jgi:uncharacterized protein YegP (UPF0339 family)
VPGKFILKRGSTGKFRFDLTSTNGTVIATSKTYATKAAAMRGVEAVRKNAPDASTDDQTTTRGGAAARVGGSKKGKVVRALQRDWEQTKSDLPGLDGKHLRQDVSDTLKQAVGKERTPPKGRPKPHR